MRLLMALFTAAVATGLCPVVGQAVEAGKLSEAPGRRYLYKHSGGKPLAVEVFRPEGHDPAVSKVPGIILFHGGNWTDGSRASLRGECGYFAARGLVAATADYRMLPIHGPDKDREAATGHLAVLATTTPELDDPADPPGIDTQVVAYVLWCPACTEADASDAHVDARRHVGAGFAPAITFFTRTLAITASSASRTPAFRRTVKKCRCNRSHIPRAHHR